ncbi:hypothetical protein [Sphingorhabdus sp.]|uniref:hypothetical protein n=1 Tax=Sphingorhabdus sp. TaxID=1902408 RepID=UPI0035939575
MLRNLLLAVFLFALALPALAVPVAPAVASETVASDCHGMPVENEKDNAEEHSKSIRLHGCIGCIAPVSPIFDVVQTVALPFVIQSALYRELSGTVAGPTIPPPRN